MPVRRRLRRVGTGVAFCSGVVALAILLLPLLLVLLMVLFDTTAHGVAVLLELLLNWLRELVVGPGSAGPLFQTLAFHPLEVALGSLARSLPCLAGLVLTLLDRRAAKWRWILLLWGLSATLGGPLVATVLLPGLAIAIVLALPRGIHEPKAPGDIARPLHGPSSTNDGNVT